MGYKIGSSDLGFFNRNFDKHKENSMNYEEFSFMYDEATVVTGFSNGLHFKETVNLSPEECEHIHSIVEKIYKIADEMDEDRDDDLMDTKKYSFDVSFELDDGYEDRRFHYTDEEDEIVKLSREAYDYVKQQHPELVAAVEEKRNRVLSGEPIVQSCLRFHDAYHLGYFWYDTLQGKAQYRLNKPNSHPVYILFPETIIDYETRNDQVLKKLFEELHERVKEKCTDDPKPTKDGTIVTVESNVFSDGKNGKQELLVINDDETYKLALAIEYYVTQDEKELRDKLDHMKEDAQKQAKFYGIKGSVERFNDESVSNFLEEYAKEFNEPVEEEPEVPVHPGK